LFVDLADLLPGSAKRKIPSPGGEGIDCNGSTIPTRPTARNRKRVEIKPV
jgi:hypothetical protein